MHKKVLLTLCLMLLALSVVKSQVTIGSSHIPRSGALLDLKEDNNLGANSKKGLGLPRVYLESNSTIEMQGAAALPTSEYINHTGLVVYNIHQKDGTQISDISEMLCPGLHGMVQNGYH